MTTKKSRHNQIGLLKQLAQYPEHLFNGSFGEQYAALCYQIEPFSHELRVLLVTSRESARWIIPKGWPMKDRKPHHAAEIEACEEAGVRGRVAKKPFGHFTYLKILEGGKTLPCVVSVYLLDVHHLDDDFKEKEQRSSEWVSCEEAARRVREPELRGLFSKLRGHLSCCP